MKELTIQPEVARMTDFELGKILGQRKAFGLVAGRCSAEQAAALKKIRDEKGYDCIAKTWDEFCTKELGMRRPHANRIIRWFEEFGLLRNGAVDACLARRVQGARAAAAIAEMQDGGERAGHFYPPADCVAGKTVQQIDRRVRGSELPAPRCSLDLCSSVFIGGQS